MTLQMPQLAFAARTDVGAHRAVNEDALCCQPPVFLIADGVGGHDAGQAASEAAIASFTHLTQQQTVTLDAVGSAYSCARANVNTISAGQARGAGTTLTGVFLTTAEKGFQWLVINVGDSRVYRYNAGVLQQITIDHTLRNEMLASGYAEDDPRLPAGNVITRALGSGADTLDTWLLPVSVSERIFICSDGLSDTLPEHEIIAGLAHTDPNAAADYLLQAALSLDARDNISLIVLDTLSAGEHTPNIVNGKVVDDLNTADLTDVVAAAQEQLSASDNR